MRRIFFLLIIILSMGTLVGCGKTISLPEPPKIDTVAPSVPASLTVTPVGSTEVSLLWAASTDDVGVTHYKVFRDVIEIATTTTTNYNNGVLFASTKYSYAVSACDVAGNCSAVSNSASVTTFAVATKDTPMKLVQVKNATTRMAVCNNGDPFVYYYRPGFEENANKWVIFLQGGGGCNNVSDCEARWTSEQGKMIAPTASTKPSDGIFSTDATRNPDFYNYNQVFMEYCSSDGWMGDTSYPDIEWIAGGTLHFRGYLIVKAVIEDLINPALYGPNLSSATFVLFAGGSAGGEGQLANVDRVAAMLPNVGKILGVTDSYYHPLVQNYPDSPTTPVDLATMPGFGPSYTYWKARPNESCVAAPENALRPSFCMTGPGTYSYLKTPTFIYEDQLDENRQREIGVIENDLNPPINCSIYSLEQRNYLIAYAKVVREAMQGLATAPAFGGGFSTAVGYHTALTHPTRYFDEKVNGMSYAEVLGNWVFDRQGETKLVIDAIPCD
jgi:hypothetical protein